MPPPLTIWREINESKWKEGVMKADCPKSKDRGQIGLLGQSILSITKKKVTHSGTFTKKVSPLSRIRVVDLRLLFCKKYTQDN